jgi:C_GCAxxG_C_C family probable redox protein
VGEHLWDKVDARMWRMAMAFGGGVGGTQQEMCGALSGGVMVIGAHMAPEGPGPAEEPMREAVARYRERFVREIGPSQCAALREGRYGSEKEGKEPCSALVQRAVRVLLRVLDGAG